MKLLVDVRKLSKKPSGIGLYTYNFLNSIKNENLEIFLVTDVIESDELKNLKRKGIKIFVYGSNVNKNIDVLKYFRYIQKSIEEIKPDIFWEPNNIIPLKLKNNYGKIIVTIHDIFPITSSEHYSLVFKTYFNICLRNTINISDALIYVSKQTKNQVENNFKKAINKYNFISYNIVDLIKNSKSIQDNNYFLFIGNIEKRKGVDLLVKAFDLYRKEGGKNKLYLGGSLRDKSIKIMIDQINNSDELVKYLGYVSNESKKELLRKCSAFVFPSKAEGFGIPPIEAISVGKPCIVSNIDIFKEILEDNVEYFNIEADESKTILNLKNKLFNYSKINGDKKNNIIYKYSAENLSNKFIDFILNL